MLLSTMVHTTWCERQIAKNDFFPCSGGQACVADKGQRVGGRTLLGFGFLRMSHISEGSQKVVGPVPRAPMKPRMSPKKGNVICTTTHTSVFKVVARLVR